MLRHRALIILLCMTVLVGTHGVATAQLDRHPFSSSDNRSWQIEYDQSRPRRDNHAIRLVVEPSDNPQPGSGPLPKVTIRAKLYQFKGLQPHMGNLRYQLKDVDDGGKVDLVGTVEGAPKNNGNSHWKKAALAYELYGIYLDGDGRARLVKVSGVYHPGRDNRKPDMMNPDRRRDDRITLRVVDRPLSEEPTSAALGPVQASEEQSDEKFAELQVNRLQAALLRLLILTNTFPCDEAAPEDAAAEEPLDDPMDATIFVYAPEFP